MTLEINEFLDRTILFVACVRGHVNIVKHICTIYVNIPMVDIYKSLFLGCKYGNLGIIMYIMNKYSLSIRCYNYECVNIVCKYNHIDILKYFLSFVNVQIPNKAIGNAFKRGNKEIVVLLSKYVDVNQSLFLIFCEEGDTEMVRLAIKEGLAISPDTLKIALEKSVDLHHTEIVYSLMNLGGDPSADSCLCVKMAINYDDIDTLKILLNHHKFENKEIRDEIVKYSEQWGLMITNSFIKDFFSEPI